MKNGESELTTDHEVIRNWIEERGGYPASVSDVGKQAEPSTLIIGFEDGTVPSDIQRLSWEEFFIRFEAGGLAFLYQDVTSSGKISRFAKFVRR